MNRGYYLLMFFVIISSQVYSQASGNQDQWIRNKFTSLGADFSKTNIRNYDAELQEVFMDMETGPYYKDSWFEIILNGFDEDMEIDDSVSFRFDMHNHELQYTHRGMNVPVELNFKFIKGFTLKDERGGKEKFIKYVGSGSKLKSEYKFFKVLSEGNDYKLLKLHYSELDISQSYGPGNDGRVKKKFIDKTSLYCMAPDDVITLIRPKSKDIIALFPNKKEEVSEFEKENGRIKNEEHLTSFFAKYL